MLQESAIATAHIQYPFRLLIQWFIENLNDNLINYFEIIDISGRIRLTFEESQVKLSEDIGSGIYFILTKDRSGKLVNAQKLVVQ